MSKSALVLSVESNPTPALPLTGEGVASLLPNISSPCQEGGWEGVNLDRTDFIQLVANAVEKSFATYGWALGIEADVAKYLEGLGYGA
jgi:hypothetical protein